MRGVARFGIARGGQEGARTITPPPVPADRRLPSAKGAPRPLPAAAKRGKVHATVPFQDAADWAPWVRGAPLAAGLASGVALAANRALSGAAFVSDAASGQSRADVLALGLVATLLLTGLQWRSMQSRPPVAVTLEGGEVEYIRPGLPESTVRELKWIWAALKTATRCGAAVVHYRGVTLMQAGAAPAGHGPAAEALGGGPLVKEAMDSGQGNYLANLGLFPGRAEFWGYLPRNAQGVLIQPIGAVRDPGSGVMVLATGTQRGFTALDQAWVATLAAKCGATLADSEV